MIGNHMDWVQFASIPIAIAKRIDLSAETKIVLAVINSRDYPQSIDQIGEDCGLDIETTHRCIATLRERGLLGE